MFILQVKQLSFDSIPFLKYPYNPEHPLMNVMNGTGSSNYLTYPFSANKIRRFSSNLVGGLYAPNYFGDDRIANSPHPGPQGHDGQRPGIFVRRSDLSIK